MRDDEVPDRLTHASCCDQSPRWGILPSSQYLLTLIVCPKATHRVGHLSQPSSGNAVEQTTDTFGIVKTHTFDAYSLNSPAVLTVFLMLSIIRLSPDA